jgi:hypothetical protein
MEYEVIDLEEQIARCRRLARMLTDDQMRTSLEALAADYEAKLGHRRSKDGEGFMLRGRPR